MKVHSQTKRRERLKTLQTFDARFWNDPDIQDIQAVKRVRRMAEKLIEEASAEDSPAKQCLAWKAAFFSMYLDSKIIKALLKEEKLDIGTTGQGLNCLTGLLRSLVFGKQVKQPHKGKGLPSKSLRLNDYVGGKRKSA